MILARVLDGIDILECHADVGMEVSDICFDSRQAKEGGLFIAMKGEKTDGHDYIPMAMAGGCGVCVCQRKPEGNFPYILVEDAKAASYKISDNFFDSPHKKLIIVGVTGTNGKTTITNLLKHVIETCLETKAGLIGTNGVRSGDNEFETSRTTPEYPDLMRYFRMMVEDGCTHCVMEVSSHSLVLGRVRGIQFRVAVFSNLTREHLDFHGTMEEYSRAKAMIFDQADMAVCNLDNDEMGDMHLKPDCIPIPTITCSCKTKKAMLFAKKILLEPDCVKFAVVTTGETVRTSLNIPGLFSVSNGLCVIGAAMELGIRLHDAAQALKSAHGVCGRLETLDTPGDFTAIIDYAHTPDALEKVLQSLRETCKGRLICVFGCGGDRDRTKRPIMGRIGTSLSDFAIITSDNPRTESPQSIIDEVAAGADAAKANYITICDRERAIEYAIVNRKPGDTILLAGKGHETYQEINGVKRHMDEREIVAEILKRGKST